MNIYNVLALVLIFCQSNFGWADTLCPESIFTKQEVKAEIGKSYEVFFADEDIPQRLRKIEFFSGHPKEKGLLEYTDFDESGRAMVATWKFEDEDKKEGIYYVCLYMDTRLTLIGKTQTQISDCILSVSKSIWVSPWDRKIESVECK